MNGTPQDTDDRDPGLVALGQRIKQARADRGWTQPELAELLGINRSTLGLIEVGRRRPSRVLVGRIAQACDVPAPWLRTGDTDEVAA